MQRRRHGSYNLPEESRRQCTLSFLLPDGEGSNLRVCKKMFCETFGIHGRIIETLASIKKSGVMIFQENRGGPRRIVYSEEDRKIVREHINSFPKDVSHYSRNSSEKEYLSSDLTLKKLYEAFQLKYPENEKITYEYYKRVFHRDFNISFRKPRADTCKTCDRLNITSRTDRKAKDEYERHLKEADRAFQAAKDDFAKSRRSRSDTCTIVIDLQKVFPLPKLSHSSMYYSRQLSAYNFGIHIANQNNAVMCVWHEGRAGRGGNEMASCILQALNSELLSTQKRHLVIYSDNCAGQLKNRMLLYLYVMLIVTGQFDVIDHKFLVSGHSFSAADRDFALIEKKAKIARIDTLDDVKSVIASARKKNPFKILDLTAKPLFDFGTASSNLLDTKDLRITSASWLRVESSNPTAVQCKNSFDPTENFRNVSILPRNMKPEEFLSKITDLQALDEIPLIKTSKLDDLINMMDYLDESKHGFFEDIFIEQISIR